MDEQIINPVEHTTTESLELCRKQLAEHEEQYQRLLADFDNYRRRIDREKVKIAWEARAKVLRGTLELVDTIERAASAIQAQKNLLGNLEGLMQALEGIDLLQKSATRFLEHQGVRLVEQVQSFDPRLHEALAYTRDDRYADGDIVEVFEKGYTLDNELLRPARVRINETETSGPVDPSEVQAE